MEIDQQGEKTDQRLPGDGGARRGRKEGIQKNIILIM